MGRMTCREYLLTDQYNDGSRLNARILLHQRFSTNSYGWPRWVFDHLGSPPESCILELGCGIGDLWLENVHRIPDGWDIVLSDLSLGMLQNTERNLAAKQERFHFAVVDIQGIPFADATFDVVIANHMLYHVPDRAQALSEAHRVLRPGGRFYAATNGRRHLWELRELVRAFVPGIAFGPRDYSFSLENGRAQLAEWFVDIRLSRYEDSLTVTEADPLVGYIPSSVGDAESVFVGNKLEDLMAFLQRELALYGAIYVSKAVGVFEGRRDDGD